MIVSSCGKLILVSSEDLIWAAGFKWNLDNKGYPRARVNGKVTHLHVAIAQRVGLKGDIDHKDRNPLNCQRGNLRPTTDIQNQGNSKLRSDNTSGYKGVSYYKKTGKWHSYIRVNKKSIFLGSFAAAEQAARAYDAAAKKYFGEFASLNFEGAN